MIRWRTFKVLIHNFAQEGQMFAMTKISEKIRSIALDSLAEDISSFRGNDVYSSDLTIVCEDKTFPVHGAVLCTRSPVFAAMLTHDTKEATECKIEIVDATPEIVELFLRFIFSVFLRQ